MMKHLVSDSPICHHHHFGNECTSKFQGTCILGVEKQFQKQISQHGRQYHQDVNVDHILQQRMDILTFKPYLSRVRFNIE
jgi:hypothetical protein